MPAINCDDEEAWRTFLERHPYLKSFEHLRPGGVRTYVAHWSGCPHGKTLVAAHSIVCARAVIHDLIHVAGPAEARAAGPIAEGCFLAEYGRADVPRTGDEKWSAVEHLRGVFGEGPVRVLFLRFDEPPPCDSYENARRARAAVYSFYAPERTHEFDLSVVRVPAGATARHIAQGLWARIGPVKKRSGRRHQRTPQERRMAAIRRAFSAGELVRVDF